MNRKRGTRLLSILLVLVMLLSMAPMTFAAETDGDGAEPADLAEAITGEEPGEEPEDVPCEEPGAVPEEPGDIPGEEPAAEPEDTPEEPGEEPVGEPAEEPAEEAPARVLLRFVSDRALTLQLTGADGPVDPAAEEEIAACLAGRGETDTEVVSEETDVLSAADDEAEPAEPVFSAAYLLAPGLYTYTAEAEGFLPLCDTIEVTGETPWGTEIVLMPEPEGLPYGFKGMPEGHALSEADLAAKRDMCEHGVLSDAQRLTPGVDYVADEVFFQADTEAEAQAVAEAYSAELLSYDWGVAVLRLKTATPVEAVRAAMDMSLPLPAVELNQVVRLPPTDGWTGGESGDLDTMSGESVNCLESWESWYADTDYPDTYLCDPMKNPYQYIHDVVNSYEAWGVTRGAGVTIAVIDTGVDTEHEDLAGAVTVATIQDDDGNEITGLNGSHGTHVAGIAAARMGNGLGVAGIAPEADILSIRSSHTVSSGIRAINRAVAEGADVINLSRGGTTYSTNELDALTAAVDAGVTVVVSMGNDGSNLKKYPASYSIPGLIAVGSVSEGGKRSPTSTYGAWEDVLAPGVDVMSTVPTGTGAYGNYDFMSGTSMAAPVVSGLCALYLSQHPQATPKAVESAIKAAMTDDIVDAAKLFSGYRTAPVFSFSDLRNGTVAYGSTIEITGRLDGDDIVYTTNNLKPAVKNGVVTWGTLYTGPIEITSDNGFTPGKKVTVQAIRVSGMGVVSKLTTRTVTVGYADPVSVYVTNAPGTLVSGKSLTLTAQVWPPEARQEVTWALDPMASQPAGVKIDAKTGTLKTGTDSVGLVTVIVTSKTDPTISAPLSFPVERISPVKTIRLNTGKSLVIEMGGWGYPPQIVPTGYDATGAEVPFAGFSYSSSNKRVLTVGSDGTLYAERKGKATVTVKALDGSGAKASCRVTVKQLATDVEISGRAYVDHNTATGYTAKVRPINANDKKVIWSVYPEPAENYYISISRKGKLIVPPEVPYGTTVRITAASEDGNALGWYDVEVRPPATYVGKIEKDTPFFGGGGYLSNPDGSLRQVTLYTIELGGLNDTNERIVDARIQLRADTDAAGLVWSSSKPEVATVDENGLVRAVSPGKTVITAKADDTSGRKSTLEVRVIHPASGVTVTSSQRNSGVQLLTAGKSCQNYVKLSDAFGTPSIQDVYWDFTVSVTNDESGERDYDLEDEIIDNGWITLSARGKLSTSSKMEPYLYDNKVRVEVSAYTTDGTELSGSVEYLIVPLITELRIDGEKEKKLTINWINGETSTHYYPENWYGSKPRTQHSWTYYHYQVSSSDPNVAGGYIEYDDRGYAYVQPVIGQKAGTATISVVAADGSLARATIKITVKPESS